MGQIVLAIAAGLTLVGSAAATLPALVVEWSKRQGTDAVFHADVSRRIVALTIDDGPSEATVEILDVLAEHGAGATFFVIGSHVDDHPDVMHRMVTEGHELGHHMLYDERSIALAPDTFATRFETVDSVLAELGGSTVFRPGSGWFDARMVRLAAQHGYRTVLGSVYPFDAQLRSVGVASWYLLQHAAPGSIMVLHDGPERGARTAEVLRRVLPELQRRGFAVVPVSDLLLAAATERNGR
jgi:peptidoglycan-N-acetylglucosamine deacetylase